MRVDGEWVGVGKGVRITAPPPDPPLPARASPAWSPARLHERGVKVCKAEAELLRQGLLTDSHGSTKNIASSDDSTAS